MRKIELKKGNLTLKDREVLGFLERKVTPIGNSAKVDCPKRFIGKRAYLIIIK
jgi:putative transposon-encoded protein